MEKMYKADRVGFSVLIGTTSLMGGLILLGLLTSSTWRDEWYMGLVALWLIVLPIAMMLTFFAKLKDGIFELRLFLVKYSIEVSKIARAVKGAGIGPYGEVWIYEKDGQKPKIKIGVGTFGSKTLRRMLNDLRTANPRIEFDAYTEKIMGI